MTGCRAASKLVMVSLLLVLLSQTAFAYRFSVLGVGKYNDPNYAECDFDDCNIVWDCFKNELLWTCVQYDADYIAGGAKSDPWYTSVSDKGAGEVWEVRDYDANKVSHNGYNQTVYGDFGWFMGHGHSGRWMFGGATYQATSGTEVFKASEDVGTTYNASTYTSNSKWNQNLEWVFFNMCWVLANSDTVLQDWAKTMMGTPERLHGIFGYNDTISGNGQVSYFLDYSTVDNLTIRSAWTQAANSFPNTTGKWAYLVHYSNRDDHFWGRGAVSADSTGAPNIWYYYSAGSRTIPIGSTSRVPINLASTATVLADVQPEPLPTERPLLAPVFLFLERLPDPALFDFDPSSNGVDIAANQYGTKYLRRASGESLRLWVSGAVDYVSGRDLDSVTTLTEKQAYAECLAFIEEHGGIPADARLTEVSVQKRRSFNLAEDATTDEETLGYTFTFSHRIAGLPVAGQASDGILVSVGAAGVDRYIRLWRDPGKELAPRRQVLSAETALDTVLGSRSMGTSLVSRVQLAYYTQPYPIVQTTSAPVWVITFDDGSQFSVDALTGGIVEEFTNWREALGGMQRTPDILQQDPDGEPQ